MSDDQSIHKKIFPVINSEFTWFIIARIMFIAGLRMAPVLLGWRLYQITGSKLSLGILGLSEVISAISFALPAGVKVDRSNKHRLISICMVFYFFLMLGLLIVTSSWMQVNTNKTIITWSIYSLVFITGIVRVYAGSAFNSFLAQLIPAVSLVRAISINSMIWLVAAVAGPALAGILIGYTNITIAFSIVCGLIGISFILFQKIKPKPVSWNSKNSKTWDAVKDGLRFVFHQKALLGAMSLDMFAVLFGGATALLPVFANDILHVGPQGLGWLVAATYLGNFVAIAYLTSRPLKMRSI